MPTEHSRSERVAEQIKRELAPMVQRFGNESKLGMLTVTAVEVSPDLRHARVAVAHLGEGVAHGEAIAALNADRGRYRRHIARHLRLRRVPALRFDFDESIERGARIEALLDELEDEEGSEDVGDRRS